MIAPLESTFTKLQKTTLFSYLLGKFNLKKKRKKKKELYIYIYIYIYIEKKKLQELWNMRFFLVTTQKFGLKITKMKSTCKLNSLVVATGLQSPGPRIDTGSTRPRIPFATKRRKRERGVRVWRWWFSLPSVCCFSVFLRRCCCLCLRA